MPTHPTFPHTQGANICSLPSLRCVPIHHSAFSIPMCAHQHKHIKNIACFKRMFLCRPCSWGCITINHYHNVPTHQRYLDAWWMCMKNISSGTDPAENWSNGNWNYYKCLYEYEVSPAQPGESWHLSTMRAVSWGLCSGREWLTLAREFRQISSPSPFSHTGRLTPLCFIQRHAIICPLRLP